MKCKICFYVNVKQRIKLRYYDKKFDGCYLDNIRIDPNYRRLRLATKMCGYVEESQEIKGFWKKRTI